MKYLSAADVVQRIKRYLSTQGMDPDALFAKAGLAWFERCPERAPDLLALSDQFSQLWEAVALATGDPLIGFRISAPDPISWLGVLGHLLLASPTLRQAGDNLMRYMPLVSPVVRPTIEARAERVRIGLNLVGGARPVPQQRYDFTWNLLLATLRFVGARPDLKPVLVEYAYPSPPAAACARYGAEYGCQVRFGAPANAIEFANGELTAPIPTANPLVADGLLRMLDERLTQAERTSFAARVREMLPSMVDQGGALRDAVARRMAVSERTLQRRLADEGTDFSTLVDEVRRTIARQHLGSDRISVKNLSYKLGFSDPSAFHRACMRWFGKAPGEFQQVRQAAGTPTTVSESTSATGPASTTRRSG